MDDEEIDYDEAIEQAKTQGMKDAIQNDDGSITYIMSRSKHKELMKETKDAIFDTIIYPDVFDE